MGTGSGVGAGGCKGRGCRAAPNQGLEGAGSQTRFLCWIISFQQFYCNYPENAAIYRVSQTAAVPGEGGGERENGRAGAGRRWEEETGKERESDRKKGNGRGAGGWSLGRDLRTPVPGRTRWEEKRSGGTCWAPRPWVQAPKWTMGQGAPGNGNRFQWTYGKRWVSTS